MSVLGYIDIKLAMTGGKMISSADIINRLLKCNWTLNWEEKFLFYHWEITMIMTGKAKRLI